MLAGEGAHGDPRKIARNWTKFKGERRLNTDRGCWQISNLYHPDVADSQAFDPDYSARKAYEIYLGAGKSFKRWCSANVVLGVKSC